MDVKDAVRARRSLRVFDPEPITDEEVDAMVEAMRLAPSCNNTQPWHVVVSAGDGLRDLKDGALNKGNSWARPAPMIMTLASKASDDCRLNEGRDYYMFSCGLSVGQMLLRATELGIIAHPIAGYDPIKVREILGIPPEYVVITLIVLGRPGNDESLLSDKQKGLQSERPPRKLAHENFHRGTWDAAWR